MSIPRVSTQHGQGGKKERWVQQAHHVLKKVGVLGANLEAEISNSELLFIRRRMGVARDELLAAMERDDVEDIKNEVLRLTATLKENDAFEDMGKEVVDEEVVLDFRIPGMPSRDLSKSTEVVASSRSGRGGQRGGRRGRRKDGRGGGQRGGSRMYEKRRSMAV